MTENADLAVICVALLAAFHVQRILDAAVSVLSAMGKFLGKE